MFHPLGMATVLEEYILVFSSPPPPPDVILASDAGKEFSEFLPRLWNEAVGCREEKTSAESQVWATGAASRSYSPVQRLRMPGPSRVRPRFKLTSIHPYPWIKTHPSSPSLSHRSHSSLSNNSRRGNRLSFSTLSWSLREKKVDCLLSRDGVWERGENQPSA